VGRTELLRESGVSYADLEAAGVFLVVVKLECSYKRPAYYDDLVEVRTRVVGSSRVKIRHEYELVRAADALAGPTAAAQPAHHDAAPAGLAPASMPMPRPRTPGELLVTATSMLACVDRSGRPAALPEWLAGA
jgi:YbgC/YbaW family acyl-CoA thioester hydrolase